MREHTISAKNILIAILEYTTELIVAQIGECSNGTTLRCVLPCSLNLKVKQRIEDILVVGEV